MHCLDSSNPNKKSLYQAPTKPAVFQNPRKKTVKPMNHNKSLKKIQRNSPKKSKFPKKIEKSKKLSAEQEETSVKNDSTLMVKLPTFAEGTTAILNSLPEAETSSMSSSSTTEDEDEFNEDEDEIYPQDRSSAESRGIFDSS